MSFPGFSFGSSKATQQSQSESQSESQSQSRALSDELRIGGNAATSFGVSGGVSSSNQFGQASANQRVAFEQLFAQLYGGAGAAAAGINTGAISSAGQQLFSGGLDFLQQLQGNPGTAALAARVGGDTSVRDAQLEVLKTGLGDLFNEELMPGITSTGVATGTLGGSRDAVARAQAAKAVAGQYATGAASILSSDQAQRDAAAGKLGELSLGSAATGLSSLDSLYGIASGGELAGLAPYQMLAAIMGGPTVLGSSQSTDVARALSESFGEQGSESYGFDFGTASSRATSDSSSSSSSTSSSSGKSKSFHFGIGG
jgi:hypothetical protein